jgi:protein-S-isoprenylcysteine O-methyltransferase Ste14
MDFFDYFLLVILSLFYLVFFARSVRAIFQGTNPFVLGAGKKGLPALIELSFFLGLAIWTTEIITQNFTLPFHFFPPWAYLNLFHSDLARGIGVFLGIGGLVIFYFALASFGSSWRVGIDKKNPGKLVTTGIFAYTRNPIFLFIDLFFLGVFFIYPNLFFGFSAVIVICGTHYQILMEEKFLREQYGKEYEVYLKKVRRYF